MSLYHLQKFLYHLNRDPRVQKRHADDLDALLDEYEPTRSAVPSATATSARSTCSARTVNC